MENNFSWIEFYMEFATKLLEYENRREELILNIYKVLGNSHVNSNYLGKNGNKTEDIDPFTIFGIFNRGLTEINRVKIITNMKSIFGIKAKIENIGFDGIPVLNNQAALFYKFEDERDETDIPNLWKLFKSAIEYSKDQREINEENFVENLDTALKIKGIKYNVTLGLFWIRPETFINLDSKNRDFILNNNLFSDKIKSKLQSLEKQLSGAEYLNFCNELKAEIQDARFDFKNFVELSWAAYLLPTKSVNSSQWSVFFEEFADKLLEYKNKRKDIADMGMKIFRTIWEGPSKFTPSGEDPINLDPFTVYAMFTRVMNTENRVTFLRKFKEFLDIKAEVPENFDGVPIFANLHTLFYDLQDHNRESVINSLWEFFEIALKYDKNQNKDNRSKFIKSFNELQNCKGINNNITFGLFWMRPQRFFYFGAKASEYLVKIDGLKNIKDMIKKFSKELEGDKYLIACEEIENQLVRSGIYKNNIELSKCIQSGKDIQNSRNIVKEKDRVRKNIILYGPPGTGKTYNTKIYAVAICEGKSIDEVKAEPYEEVAKRYETLRENKKILFTTFHQSYSYEEFIEGIKPCFDDEKNFEYQLKDGIFKEFCKNMMPTKYNFYNPNVWCVHLNDNSKDNDLKNYCFKNDEIRIGWPEKMTKTVDTNNIQNNMKIGDIVVVFKQQDGVIDGVGIVSGDYEYDINEHKEFPRKRKVEYISKEIEINISDLNNGRKLPIGTLRQLVNFVDEGYKELFKKVDYSEEEYSMFMQTILNSKDNEPRVFVIDEINRGNISKIFGELITLIEESKRRGNLEEAMVILPYSGEEFYVPDNLYILGTMNTADRSIAIMDTALRRRFLFQELMPDLSVLKGIIVDGIDVQKMVEVINKRITYLYDRDHTIGHSYFISLKDNPTINNLGMIFKEKIIPLLQEYFYEDYEKIQLILGDNQKDDEFKFIVDTEVDSELFGKNIGDIDLSEKMYELQKDAFENKQSYIGIYEKIDKNTK